MNSKVLLTAAVLTFSAPLGALANEKDLAKSLNLKGDKAEQVEKIVDQYKDQAEKVKDQAKDQLSDLRDQKDEQLKAVLSEAEYDRYKSLKDAKKDMKEDWAKQCEKDGKWLGME